MTRCLCCEKEVRADQPYHPACLKKLFDKEIAVTVPFGQANFPTEVQKVVGRMSAISGVQPKAFVRIDADGMMVFATTHGTHIIKPPQPQWPDLPQNENLSMNIAELLEMETAPHALIRMADGAWAYLTRRFDRLNGKKIHKEDMAQILGMAVADKYEGSLEKVGQAILKHSTYGGLNVINFFERVLLSFIIGNNDMHLKNWSLLELDRNTRRLAPCYDLVSTALYIPEGEESALALNGKRNKLSRSDFDALAEKLQINERAQQNGYERILDRRNEIINKVENSFLSEPLKQTYIETVNSRSDRLAQMALGL